MANEALKKFIQRLKTLESFAQGEASKFVNSSGQEIEQDNVSQMFELGQDQFGNPLGDYSAATKRIKAAKGQRTDHITLRDTGDFHKGITIVQQSIKSWRVIGTDRKTPMLNERYNVLGLTPFNAKKWQDRLVQHLIPSIERYLVT